MVLNTAQREKDGVVQTIASSKGNQGAKIMKETSNALYAFLTLLLIIAVWGGYNWVLIMFVKGVGITGSSDLVPWGVYIIGFIFFGGASAGASIIGLMIHGFGRGDYKPLGVRAILVGILSLMAAVLFLFSDVGNPFRTMLLPAVLRNTTSALVYTSITYVGFAALMLGELYYAVKFNRSEGAMSDMDEKMAKVLAILALLFALMVVHAPHGALFAFIKAREMWNTPLLPPHFVVVALATGTAIMILVAIITSKINKRELVGIETLNHMGVLLALFVTVTLFLDFFDYLVMIYTGKPAGIEIWHLLTGRFAPLFIVNTAGLFAAMLILLFKRGRTIKGLSIASSLTLIAIMAYRIDLIIVAQIPPLFPGIGEIYYIPTVPEMAVVAGLIALTLFLYLVLTKVLPMEETVPDLGAGF
jgi:molybdopterin-containing oxidoreductase family membrane subunit